MLLAATGIRFLCHQINAEACTTQRRMALRRLLVLLEYSLHAGCISRVRHQWQKASLLLSVKIYFDQTGKCVTKIAFEAMLYPILLENQNCVNDQPLLAKHQFYQKQGTNITTIIVHGIHFRKLFLIFFRQEIDIANQDLSVSSL